MLEVRGSSLAWRITYSGYLVVIGYRSFPNHICGVVHYLVVDVKQILVLVTLIQKYGKILVTVSLKFSEYLVQGLMKAFRVEDLPIESKMLTKALDEAQRKVENYFFDIRKQLFEYDEVLNSQRDRVYADRRRALESKNLQALLLEYSELTMDDILEVGALTLVYHSLTWKHNLYKMCSDGRWISLICFLGVF